MKFFLRFFLQGMLLVLPLCFTLYILYSLFVWIDKLLPKLFGMDMFPGVGILVIIAFVTLMGFIGSTLVARPAFAFLEYYIYKVPLVNLIYSSSKDVIGAFVGDKKKFSKPVLVRMGKADDVYRLGFITREDLSSIHLHDMIAVYFPDSYGLTGNLYIVPKEHVKEIPASGSDIMKFIVSGGVSGVGAKADDAKM
ncbi:MAG: DUF502 domain-containing protein [Cytophagaceae bacterium]|nr:DUF502 domain-containing protein [Cytophagaceae bacterium]MDW8456180.1 DUF502 domain-containing protein [Cytophagaceae bacterium]